MVAKTLHKVLCEAVKCSLRLRKMLNIPEQAVDYYRFYFYCVRPEANFIYWV